MSSSDSDPDYSYYSESDSDSLSDESFYDDYDSDSGSDSEEIQQEAKKFLQQNQTADCQLPKLRQRKRQLPKEGTEQELIRQYGNKVGQTIIDTEYSYRQKPVPKQYKRCQAYYRAKHNRWEIGTLFQCLNSRNVNFDPFCYLHRNWKNSDNCSLYPQRGKKQKIVV